MPTQAEIDDFAKSFGGGSTQAPAATANSASPDVQDFAASWGTPTQSPSPTPESASPTNPALQGLGFWAQQARTPSAIPEIEAETIAANQAGVPLDVRSGASVLTRLRLGAERNRMQQLQMLRDQYGDAVRMTPQGEWIVRATDEAGNPKDILVNEERMTVGDLAAVMHKAPALALSIMTTKGIPAASIFKQAVMGALGWAGGEAATDVASRIGRTDIQPGEILTERGGQALADTALGYGAGRAVGALGTLGQLLRMASTDTLPALSEGASLAARQRVQQGREAVKGTTGVALEPTIGELTGNPIIQRLEAFFSNIPLARGFILKNIERRMANERAIQEALLKQAGGTSADVPDATRLGEDVVAALSGKLRGLEEQAGELTGTLRQEATEALTEPLSEIGGRALSPFQLGKRIEKRGELQLQNFKSQATERFDVIRAMPQANNPAFDAMPIQMRAIALKDELVKGAGGDVEKALAPTGVLAQLDAIDRLPSDQSYFDLIKLRDAIYDRIGSPEPISDRGTRILKGLGAEITQQLEKQGPSVFGQDWKYVQDTNKFYRDNVESFYQKGIIGMLKPRTEAGAIDPERIVGQIVAGGRGSVSSYNTLRDFFKDEAATGELNRALRDHLIDAGTDKATGLMNLENLAGSVSKMEPELVRAIYGTDKQALMRDAREAQTGLRVFGKAGAIPERGTQASVEADALKEALARGEIKSGTLKALAATTAEKERAYTLELAKALEQGDTRLVEAAPEKFVRGFLLNPGTSERAANDAMRHLLATGDDQLIGDVRRIYLADLFKAGAAPAAGDVQQLVGMQTGSPLRNLDPQRFAITLEDEGVKRRMQLVLGRDLSNAVREFGIAMSGRAGRDAAATATGSFAGGSYTHALLHVLGGKWGAAKALPDLAQYRVMSYILTHPESVKSLRTVAGHVPNVSDLDEVIKAMTLTPEFAHALAVDSTSPEEAAEVTRAVQAWATNRK